MDDAEASQRESEVGLTTTGEDLGFTTGAATVRERTRGVDTERWARRAAGAATTTEKRMGATATAEEETEPDRATDASVGARNDERMTGVGLRERELTWAGMVNEGNKNKNKKKTETKNG